MPKENIDEAGAIKCRYEKHKDGCRKVCQDEKTGKPIWRPVDAKHCEGK